MRITCGQCFVIPEEDCNEALTTCLDEMDTPSVANAHALASQLADREGETMVVLQIARIVNPSRGRDK